jgi:hypothetical protein
MSGLPDPIQIARMPFTQRNQTLMQMLPMLLRMKPEEAENVVSQLINVLASKATDQEYKDWCDSMLRALSQYDISIVKAVLNVRMSATSKLPADLRERDSKIVNEVLSQLDEPVRNKIMQAMK